MYPGGGHLSFPLPGQQGAQIQKPYSDDVAELFDEEVKSIVDSAFKRTKALLEEKAEEVCRVIGPPLQSCYRVSEEGTPQGPCARS